MLHVAERLSILAIMHFKSVITQNCSMATHIYVAASNTEIEQALYSRLTESTYKTLMMRP